LRALSFVLNVLLGLSFVLIVLRALSFVIIVLTRAFLFPRPFTQRKLVLNKLYLENIYVYHFKCVKQILHNFIPPFALMLGLSHHFLYLNHDLNSRHPSNYKRSCSHHQSSQYHLSIDRSTISALIPVTLDSCSHNINSLIKISLILTYPT